jgi:predicted amidophosphoribosyltransferase
MLAICTQCESAQDVEKAGIVCWFCGQEMSDTTRDHQGERGPSEWVGATAAG